VAQATAVRPHETDHTYAGLVSRLAALSIDVVVVTVASTVVRTAPPVMWEGVLGGSAPGWLTVGSAALASLFPWLYFTLCWWLTGQTVGDIALGVIVCRQDGARVSLIQAGLRALIGLALAPLWIVGLLAILWEPRRRAWHDRVFRTVVRYSRRHPPT
jgi:uncharacterized RDD family membrane protein YckC